jgi:hypothetical protein
MLWGKSAVRACKAKGYYKMTEFSDYARLSLGSPDRRRVDECVNWLIDRDSTVLLTTTGEKRAARRQKLQEMFSSPEGLHILWLREENLPQFV